MFTAASLTLALAASYVSARPIASEVVAAVNTALQLPNTTQTNPATWYYQNGNAGACGLYSEDSDLVVGLPLEFYNDTGSVSAYCGSYIVVTNTKNNYTVTSRVADASAGSEQLSLSLASWNALNGDSSDLSTVTWRFANATEVAIAKGTSASVVPAATPYSSPSSVVAAAAPPAATTTTTTQAYVPPPTTTTTTTTQKTTTTTKAAATTQAKSDNNSGSSSSGGSGSYSGQATWFTQNGVAGACGSVSSDSDYIVALDSRMYNGGAYCGKSLTIYGNGKSITARVADECPTCASSGSLDLSTGAFKALSDLGAGVVSITWSWN